MDVYNFFQRNRDTNSKKINFVLDIIEKGLEEIRENCILNEFAKKFQQLYYNHP
jgi:hypothetical protein